MKSKAPREQIAWGAQTKSSVLWSMKIETTKSRKTLLFSCKNPYLLLDRIPLWVIYNIHFELYLSSLIHKKLMSIFFHSCAVILAILLASVQYVLSKWNWESWKTRQRLQQIWYDHHHLLKGEWKNKIKQNPQVIKAKYSLWPKPKPNPNKKNNRRQKQQQNPPQTSEMKLLQYFSVVSSL